MSTVAIITDSHFGARSDSLPMQASMRRFYEELFFPALDRHAVKTVLHAGDYGDRRKYVNIGTSNFVDSVYQRPLADRGIEQHILAGNHDIYYRHSTEVNTIEELCRHNANVHVYTTPTEVSIDGCDMLFLPWIVDSNRKASLDAIATTKCSIVLGHLEISGYQMFRGIPNHEGLTAEMFQRFKLVMTGHFHHRTTSDPIVYLGAPYPMIWSDYGDPRGFHLFDTDTHELTYIQNPHSLFVKLFYDDKGKKHDYVQSVVQDILAPDSAYHDAYIKVVVRTREQPYWYDLVMDALYKVNAQDILVVDDINIDDTEETEPTSENPDIDTLTLMKEFVDSLSISCDKDELFAFLQAKYHEAIAASQSARLL
jgi:DNA repair exonuclease SbcCD nuclease subunit